MRDIFIDSLFNLAKRDKNVFLITADLGFKIFDKFEKFLPKQYLNVGVAEQNMIGVATGIGLQDCKVFVYSIANFATMRCLEQIRNDAAYHNINLTIVASGGGFNYGSLGMSHHATEDIAIMRSLPNVKVYTPSSSWEVKNIMRFITKKKGVKYLRIEKESNIFPPKKYSKFIFEEPVVFKDGTDCNILCAGSILSECLDAAFNLEDYNISAKVISINTIKPLSNSLLSKLNNSQIIFSVEEHNRFGGLGSAINELLTEKLQSFKFKIYGINDKYVSIVGDQKFLRKICKINSRSIQKNIIKYFKKNNVGKKNI